ncbi:MAG TPA: DMT family transporter [Desulfobulbus sp.]|nr:DMT family transporter [Desulfobulbus sp.]
MQEEKRAARPDRSGISPPDGGRPGSIPETDGSGGIASQLHNDLLLLLVAAIWGFGFVAQRAGMEHLGPHAFNGIRFLLGSLVLVPMACRPRDEKELGGQQIPALAAGILPGLVLTAGAALQQTGLRYTTAGKAGFITGLYVIMVPLIGMLLGQRTDRGTWIGGLLAVLGLYLLSVRNGFALAPGDLLELAGAVFWAVHVLLLGYLSPRSDPIRLAMVQFAICGLLSLALAIRLETITLTALREAMVPLAYGGICSVGLGYTLQVVVQRRAHPAHAAILLSLEAPFAAFGGWWLLGEVLSARALAGCLLMLAGMLTSRLWPLLTEKERPAGHGSGR